MEQTEILNRIADILESQGGIPYWDILTSIIPWGTALISIFLLLKERAEDKRPYLQVNYELIRSSMACIVIRNVGRVPLTLKSMVFNDEFINQLDHNKIKHLKNKRTMNVTIFPNKYWVLGLDKNSSDIINDFDNKVLNITYSYSKYNRKKLYEEDTVIDFEEYRSFLVYLSEVDEFKNDVSGKLENITSLCDKIEKHMPTSYNKLNKKGSNKRK